MQANQINIQDIIKLAEQAGEAIMKIYSVDFSVEYKDDKSPLTDADRAANAIIIDGLKSTGIPVLSEEGKAIPYQDRKNWTLFWLVDPLDGTKEFIKKNGEFTVNIALIENGHPVMGVVYAPAMGITYYGSKSEGSFKKNSGGQIDKLPLPGEHNRAEKIRVVASRSHMSPETEEFVASLKEKTREIEFLSSGSSLKLCLIAEGAADIYPRLAPTME